MSVVHRVVVYYQTQYDQSQNATSPYGFYVSPIPLIHLITHLIVAAFHLNLNNSNPPITLNDNAPDHPMFDQMWKDVKQVQANGIPVMGLLGGAAPGSYDCLTPDNFDTYYPYLHDTIVKHSLDGVDLDVEQAVSISDIENLIRKLRTDFGPDFTITLAPVASALLDGGNLSGFNYAQLEQDAGTEINWYNAQFYSGFGSIFPDDQYINITKQDLKLKPSRLVASTLTNPKDGSGYVPPDEVVNSIRSLCKMFGSQFGGVAGWEYFNSLPAPGKPWLWAQNMTETMRDVEANTNSTSGGGNGDGNGIGLNLKARMFGKLDDDLRGMKTNPVGFLRRREMALARVVLSSMLV